MSLVRNMYMGSKQIVKPYLGGGLLKAVYLGEIMVWGQTDDPTIIAGIRFYFWTTDTYSYEPTYNVYTKTIPIVSFSLKVNSIDSTTINSEMSGNSFSTQTDENWPYYKNATKGISPYYETYANTALAQMNVSCSVKGNGTFHYSVEHTGAAFSSMLTYNVSDNLNSSGVLMQKNVSFTHDFSVQLDKTLTTPYYLNAYCRYLPAIEGLEIQGVRVCVDLADDAASLTQNIVTQFRIYYGASRQSLLDLDNVPSGGIIDTVANRGVENAFEFCSNSFYIKDTSSTFKLFIDATVMATLPSQYYVTLVASHASAYRTLYTDKILSPTQTSATFCTSTYETILSALTPGSTNNPKPLIFHICFSKTPGSFGG